MLPFNQSIDDFCVTFFAQIDSGKLARQCDYFYNSFNRILSFANAGRSDFEAFRETLAQMGFTEKEARFAAGTSFSAFLRENIAVFLSYYENIGEIRFVVEENSAYFDYRDTFRSDCHVPTLVYTPLLEDYGMSEVIRLSDGRYLIFDGGDGYGDDAAHLFAYLQSHSPHKRPQVAAWIITHPHHDHYGLLIPFLEQFAKEVCIERIFITFPNADDSEQFAELDEVFAGERASDAIRRLFDLIAANNIPTLTVHTGQRFQIGNTVSEVLSSQDDFVDIQPQKKKNALSFVFKMEVEGQTILWTGDTQFDEVKLDKRYRDYLKCDILQVPHHGFGGGTPAGYDWMRPEVCILPISHYNAYYSFDSFLPNSNYLFTKSGVSEIIDGSADRTITLPYHASRGAKDELQQNFLAGRDANGSVAWVFSDLNTANEEDVTFTLTNMTYITAQVSLDLFFEDRANVIRMINIEAPRLSVAKINLRTGEGLGAKKGIFRSGEKAFTLPEGKLFSARFIASHPIIIAQKGKTANYCAPNR